MPADPSSSNHSSINSPSKLYFVPDFLLVSQSKAFFLLTSVRSGHSSEKVASSWVRKAIPSFLIVRPFKSSSATRKVPEISWL
jgi:hypothetical protein